MQAVQPHQTGASYQQVTSCVRLIVEKQYHPVWCAYMRIGAHLNRERSVCAVELPSEAALILERRTNRLPSPSISLRDAAAAATSAGIQMSESGWRSIEKGRYEAKPEVLAVMARVVGVTPAELEQVAERDGRDNARRAAVMLRAYVRNRAENEPALAALAPRTPEAVLQMILEGIDDIRNAPGLTGDQKGSLEKSLIEAVTQTVAGQIAQIRTTLEIVQQKAR